MEKKQTMRYTDQELSIIKNTFSENDGLLKLIRKIMLQLPLNAVDLSNLKLSFKGKKELLDVIRKTFLPTIDPEAPFNQLIDLWMTVNILEKLPNEAEPHLIARDRLIKYIDQQLRYLETGKEGDSKFNDFNWSKDKDQYDNYSDLVTRNTMISHTEQQLSMLSVLAGMKDETVEQTKDRLKKDSSK